MPRAMKAQAVRKKRAIDKNVPDERHDETGTEMVSAKDSKKNSDSFVPLDSATVAELRNVGSKRRRRSSAGMFQVKPNSLFLTDAERADITTFRKRYAQMVKDSEQRELARAFRILDLPPEIRLRIYHIGFKELREKQEYLLATVVTPPITRACKTLRQEALPVFFADTVFVLPIGTNAIQRAQQRQNGVSMESLRSASVARRAGILNIKQTVKHTLRYAGNDAIFRHIKLELYEAGGWTIKSSHTWRGQLRYLATVSCDLDKGQLSVAICRRPADRGISGWLRHSFRSNNVEYRAQDVDDMIDEVRRIAAQCAAQTGFKGLKLQDLQKMAKVFRFQLPRNKPVPKKSKLIEGGDVDEEDEDSSDLSS